MIRVVFFIDGFNLYHAIASLKVNHLKWLDLKKLCQNYAISSQFSIEDIYYFSAIAHWLIGPKRRHEKYLAALKTSGVKPILGKFKNKDRWCRVCKKSSKGHEEKETDVNIALHILDSAYQNSFDRAVIISGDSDLSPAIRLARKRFPKK